MKKSVVLMLLVGTLLSSTVLAESYWCRGKLSGVYVTDTGDVVINGAWRSDWTQVCNLRGDDGVDTTGA